MTQLQKFVACLKEIGLREASTISPDNRQFMYVGPNDVEQAIIVGPAVFVFDVDGLFVKVAE